MFPLFCPPDEMMDQEMQEDKGAAAPVIEVEVAAAATKAAEPQMVFNKKFLTNVSVNRVMELIETNNYSDLIKIIYQYEISEQTLYSIHLTGKMFWSMGKQLSRNCVKTVVLFKAIHCKKTMLCKNISDYLTSHKFTYSEIIFKCSKWMQEDGLDLICCELGMCLMLNSIQASAGLRSTPDDPLKLFNHLLGSMPTIERWLRDWKLILLELKEFEQFETCLLRGNTQKPNWPHVMKTTENAAPTHACISAGILEMKNNHNGSFINQNAWRLGNLAWGVGYVLMHAYDTKSMPTDSMKWLDEKIHEKAGCSFYDFLASIYNVLKSSDFSITVNLVVSYRSHVNKDCEEFSFKQTQLITFGEKLWHMGFELMKASYFSPILIDIPGTIDPTINSLTQLIPGIERMTLIAKGMSIDGFMNSIGRPPVVYFSKKINTSSPNTPSTVPTISPTALMPCEEIINID